MQHILMTTVEAQKSLSFETIYMIDENGMVVGKQTVTTMAIQVIKTEEIIPVEMPEVETVALIPVDVYLFDPDQNYTHLAALKAHVGIEDCDVELVFDPETETVKPQVKQ